MAFDPRSRQRLEELGRRLPKALPSPDPVDAAQAPGSKRHRIETETDPQQLFGELMRASPDGTVPPHLLDRLRQLEQQPGRGRPVGSPAPDGPATVRPKGATRSKTEATDPRYVAFEQMLLEDESL
ncbi:MAG: hypothetical protein EBZ51_00550 [Synechococcaceae bacterium WB9_2_112]|jgi:hypothetical protein|nr:hypothetical protein [Synechococcaceae bacterium WB9_2_112]